MGRVGRDLQDGAVRADRRRADLDEEVARDRDPRRMAAGEGVEADVAERVDEQGGGRLGVARRVEPAALVVAEQQLIAHDAVALVGDGLAHDGHLGPPVLGSSVRVTPRNVGCGAPELSGRARNFRSAARTLRRTGIR